MSALHHIEYQPSHTQMRVYIESSPSDPYLCFVAPLQLIVHHEGVFHPVSSSSGFILSTSTGGGVATLEAATWQNLFK